MTIDITYYFLSIITTRKQHYFFNINSRPGPNSETLIVYFFNLIGFDQLYSDWASLNSDRKNTDGDSFMYRSLSLLEDLLLPLYTMFKLIDVLLLSEDNGSFTDINNIIRSDRSETRVIIYILPQLFSPIWPTKIKKLILHLCRSIIINIFGAAMEQLIIISLIEL
ncbi:hypothetical protein ACJX0J_027714 [Zea mays]